MPGLLVVLLLAAVVAWLLAPGVRKRAEPGEIEPADQDELEAAEREVRDLDLHQQPEDGFEGDDWGPGTGRRSKG